MFIIIIDGRTVAGVLLYALMGINFLVRNASLHRISIFSSTMHLDKTVVRSRHFCQCFERLCRKHSSRNHRFHMGMTQSRFFSCVEWRLNNIRASYAKRSWFICVEPPKLTIMTMMLAIPQAVRLSETLRLDKTSDCGPCVSLPR